MLSLRFDNEKEYFFINNEWVGYPLGAAFIDFICDDYLNRDFENIPSSEENPLLLLFKSKLDIMKLSDEDIDIIAFYFTLVDLVLNLDNEIFRDVDISIRYYICQRWLNSNYLNNSIEVKYLWQSSEGIVIPDVDYPTTEEMVDNLKKYNLSLVQMYSIDSIRSALYISFIKMMEHKVRVKKCKCCDNFFIPSGRIDAEYCDRYAPNSSKTCREIGAIKKYHEKSKSNPIMKEFQKIYKKMNSRVRIKKITQDYFYFWSEKARELRDRAIQENMSFEDFKEKLDNLEV